MINCEDVEVKQIHFLRRHVFIKVGDSHFLNFGMPDRTSPKSVFLLNVLKGRAHLNKKKKLGVDGTNPLSITFKVGPIRFYRQLSLVAIA